MAVTTLLVANRGEVAVRVLRTASALGMRTVAVFAEDDGDCLHIRLADAAVALAGTGPAAYLDGAQLVRVAVEHGCDAVHPGWGFLSEDAGFARQCVDAGLTFVGPRPETLELLGDKGRARDEADRLGISILAGTRGPTTVDEARALLSSLGDGASLVVKALAGGGGRGIRPVHHIADLDAAYQRCRSEAAQAFGRDEVYVERWLRRARHVEVQVAGDTDGDVVTLGDRECSLQRRHQKLVEMAPAPGLSNVQREHLVDAALRLASAVRLVNLATFEFLVDLDAPEDGDPNHSDIVFIEANPRLQVEHTVTEEVTGLDLVELQLRLAVGDSLVELGLGPRVGPEPRGMALQARVNLETMTADGETRPSGGTITAFQPPVGPGVRVDTFAYAGYRTSPRYDSLLAKIVVRSPSGDVTDVTARAARAVTELRVDGVDTNAPFLRRLLEHPAVRTGDVHTAFVDDHLAELVPPVVTGAEAEGSLPALPGGPRRAGASVDRDDPLAVLEHGRSPAGVARSGSAAEPAGGGARPAPVAGPPGTVAVAAPVQGTVVAIDVDEGDTVHPGRQLVVMEAMKMEHVVTAPEGGVVRTLAVATGDTLYAGEPLLFFEPADADVAAGTDPHDVDVDLDHVRPDLAEVVARHEVGLDPARPDAVARRHDRGQRTARENVDDLCDPGSFVEYGPLVIAAQRRRRPVEELIERTPADGLISGIGTVNADLVGADRARCVVMAYDYTVLAGTQGLQNHRKKDRLFELAEQLRLPMVFFTEGGGGRPGDTDGAGVAGLDTMAFHLFGRLSGLVPLVGIVAGRCFAGNAALLGCCDVVIATEGANIGMGGPAMIEGGGLGVFRPEEVGPLDVQVPNGVVDVAVADEAEAVAVARRYLSYFQGVGFQGAVGDWGCDDQRLLRRVIPENRLRVYDVRRVIGTLADTGSVLELRRAFGPGMVTALARIEGRSVGIVANDPTHLAGAIDADGADKAARFMQLCDAFDVPLVFLCDTPGIMVGPEVERTALVRHCSRMFVTGASLTVPFCTIVLRKGYGLGAQAMAGGSFKAPLFTVAWPTGEFGGMGLEGAVKLGYRNELAAVDDPAERRALFDEMVARMYEHGKAVNMASHFEIDDVIDPADTRRWISAALAAAPEPPPRTGKKRPCVDTW